MSSRTTCAWEVPCEPSIHLSYMMTDRQMDGRYIVWRLLQRVERQIIAYNRPMMESCMQVRSLCSGYSSSKICRHDHHHHYHHIIIIIRCKDAIEGIDRQIGCKNIHFKINACTSGCIGCIYSRLYPSSYILIHSIIHSSIVYSSPWLHILPLFLCSDGRRIYRHSYSYR